MSSTFVADFILGEEIISSTTNRLTHKVPDLIVAGVSEGEIFDMAPAMVCDRIYWDTESELEIAELNSQLSVKSYTRQWSDGHHRIWVPEGLGESAREEIRAWCVARGVTPFNLRIEKNVPFRDLDSIPGSLVEALIAECVAFIYPRTFSVRRRLVNELDAVDDEDVFSMMYLYLHDLADRFDANRVGKNGTLNFTAYALAKVKTWPQDLVRSTYGRTLASDRVGLAKVEDEIFSARGRRSTAIERADALGISLTQLREREHSIGELSRIRHADSLFPAEGEAALEVASEENVADSAVARIAAANLTKSILTSVDNPENGGRRPCDPLALAVVYLTFWEGLSKTEAAQQLDVLPKTAAAALARALERIDPQGLR